MESEVKFAEEWPQDTSVRERTMTLLLSLFLILLAFFVQMSVFATKEPSRADSAVSSVKDTFGRSLHPSDEGRINAPAGVLISDTPFLDAVISAIRGRDNMGIVKSAVSDGILTVRLLPDRLFVANTGVMHPDGMSLLQKIAQAMLAGEDNDNLRSMEIRFIVPADEILNVAQRQRSDAVPVRQGSALAAALSHAGVSLGAISVSMLAGDAPMLELRFFATAAASWNVDPDA